MQIEQIKSWEYLFKLVNEQKVKIAIDRNEDMQIHIVEDGIISRMIHQKYFESLLRKRISTKERLQWVLKS